MPEYTRQDVLSVKFPNGINVGNYKQDIQDSSITKNLKSIVVDEGADTVDTIFWDTLLAADETELDNIQSNHDTLGS